MNATRTRPKTARPARRYAIVNPAAGAGRHHPRVLEALTRGDGPIPRDLTRRPGEARDLAFHAARAGADVVVAAGGDGTIHEVVNGIFDADERAALGVLDAGTGRGFAESLGLPPTHRAQRAVVDRGHLARVDVGRLSCSRPGGPTVERVFVSECQVGVGAAVCARLGRPGKRLGGRLGFLLATLVAGLWRQAVPLSVSLDDGPFVALRLLGVVVANGSHTAGGMRLAPAARLADGRLDVVLIHDMSIRRRLGLLRRVYRGEHVDGLRCSVHPVRRLRLRAPEPVPVAADGEVLGVTPLDVEVLPRALRVLTPEGRI